MRQGCSRTAGGAPWDSARGTSGTELAAAVVAACGAVEQRPVERVVPRGDHRNDATISGGVSTRAIFAPMAGIRWRPELRGNALRPRGGAVGGWALRGSSHNFMDESLGMLRVAAGSVAELRRHGLMARGSLWGCAGFADRWYDRVGCGTRS